MVLYNVVESRATLYIGAFPLQELSPGTQDFWLVLSLFFTAGTRIKLKFRVKKVPQKVPACKVVLFQTSGIFGGGTWALTMLIG